MVIYRSAEEVDCACIDNDSCLSCAKTNSWVPFLKVTCRWCPLDRRCHTVGSVQNPCTTEMNIDEPTRCPLNEGFRSDYNPSEAYTNALLAAVSYAEPEYAQKCLNHSLPNHDFEMIEAIGRKCDGIFDYKECFAYTAVSHTRKLIIVSFRGTAAFTQLVHQLGETLSPKLFKQYGYVHSYFKYAFERLYPCIKKSVQTLVTKHSNYDVFVTGHSLGGAIASLAAISLRERDLVTDDKMSLYTFGMPRAGSREYAFNFDKKVRKSWRIVHYQDMVSIIPPRLGIIKKKIPYHHHGEVYYPDAEMNKYSRYNMCHGNEDDPNCSRANMPYTEDMLNTIANCILSSKIKCALAVGTQESECDFEKDFCGWTRGNGSTFNFKRAQGATDEGGKTGPSADRKGSNKGFFIFADASGNDDQVAKLRSPNFPTGDYCLKFFYHMYGKDMGKLTLWLKVDGIKRTNVWNKYGDHGKEWIKEEAFIKNQAKVNGTLHFEFEAKMGKGFASDIALDDISVKPGNCKSN
ncbi:LIP1-like protein [Mya arenaria]|uniref:LIP1-like protein n=1 Tax=Mya arenaria TaxID=6604 RepID=A0ABY7FB63_MYAAR|nr:LIP1-like protein [Mya arenaria]